MQIATNVYNMLALNEAPPVVQVQQAASAPGVATAVTAGLVATGQEIKAQPGEALLIPAVAPAVVAKAVPSTSKFAGSISTAQAILAGLYSVLGEVILNVALDTLTQPGAIERLGIPSGTVSLAIMGILSVWRDHRRRKALGAQAAK